MNENKFYIKSVLIETIASLVSLSPDEYDLAQELLIDIKNIQNKDALFKIIMSEFFKEEVELKQNIIAYILNEVYSVDELKENLWAILKSRNYSDEIQNKILNLIKSFGEIVNYDEYVKYFDDPDKIIDSDTEKLLDNAMFNPESQIDFLDFISTLSNNDWQLMINSLAEDFSNDNFANILVPLLYVNLQNEEKLNNIIEVMGKTSSSLALEPLEAVTKYCIFESSTKLAKKNINILKLKGKNIKQAKSFYQNSLVNTTFHEAYTSYPDGHGNQCIIYTRKNSNGSIQYFSSVIRDLKEIVDCFGFNELTENEYNNILQRFVNSQHLIKVHDDVIKTMLDYALNYSLANNFKIPYEILCWKTLLEDVQNEFPLQEKLAETINSKYSKFEFNQDSLDYFETWFFDENDSFFKKTIDFLIPTLSMEDTIINFYDTLKQNYNQFEIKKKIQYRLQILSVFMSLCGNKALLSTISALNNQESYLFLEEFMLRHSIYEYFLRESENINSNRITNIFTKKTDSKAKKFNDLQILNAINFIEGNW